MSVTRHNPELVSAVVQISAVAYGSPRATDELYIHNVATELPDIPPDLLDDGIEALSGAGLLRRRIEGRLSLNATGKVAHEEGCVSELVFGEAYVLEKYSHAVVHVIVKTPGGDERGGTGFIIAEPDWAIVTAKHVVENNELLRIVKRDGAEVCMAGAEILLAPQGIDLAAVVTNVPRDVAPMRIEWRDQGAVDSEPVTVLGYPPIAGHEPALIPVNAEATVGVPTYGRQRKSLVLQRLTTPGFSGGPVVDRRGMVIGIVREEGASDVGQGPGVFVFGTPAHYIAEFLV